jgi:hypothetical protein
MRVIRSLFETKSSVVLCVSVNSEIAGTVVAARSRVRIVPPVLVSELPFPVERASALPSPARKDVLGVLAEAVKGAVEARAGRFELFLLEPSVLLDD